MKTFYLFLTACAALLLTALALGHAGAFARAQASCPIVTASSASLPWHFRHGQPQYGSGLHCQLTGQR